MDTEIQSKKIISRPDFGKIFQDMAQRKNLSDSKVKEISSQKEWNSLDVIKMNEKIFGKASIGSLSFNQKHKAYDKSSIIEILNYQKEYSLNDTEMMKIFKISRNTINKWQKLFNRY